MWAHKQGPETSGFFEIRKTETSLDGCCVARRIGRGDTYLGGFRNREEDPFQAFDLPEQ